MFLDSVHLPQWLARDEADELFRTFARVAEQQRPRDLAQARATHSKYPLWTKTYGLRRGLDRAVSLDRWGAYPEGWLRVDEDPPAVLLRVRERLLREFYPPRQWRERFRDEHTHSHTDSHTESHLNESHTHSESEHSQEEGINSMVVNFYFTRRDTYIPAHRDTTACLEAESEVLCLSLGAARDFSLVPNAQCGVYRAQELDVVRQFRVRHGDLFALGRETNELYCHVVPQEKESESETSHAHMHTTHDVHINNNNNSKASASDICDNINSDPSIKNNTNSNENTNNKNNNNEICPSNTDFEGGEMRISIIFRSVNKSFLDRSESVPEKQVTYASGKTRSFRAECVTCSGYADPGTRVHIADMIQERENQKMIEKLLLQQEKEREQQDQQEEEKEIALPLSAVSLLSDYEREVLAQNLSPEERASLLQQREEERERAERETFLTASPSSTKLLSASASVQRTLDAYYMGEGVAVPKTRC